MEVEVSMEKEEVVIIIIKKFVIRICALELNLFGLVTCVSYYKIYRQELKLIAACLTIL